jgi:hypothetical protein
VGQLKSAANRLRSELPRQGSNLDSSDPESDVLPVTPRGSDPILPSGAEGSRTPDLLGAIQALSQLSYSPKTPLHTSAAGQGRQRIGPAKPGQARGLAGSGVTSIRGRP